MLTIIIGRIYAVFIGNFQRTTTFLIETRKIIALFLTFWPLSYCFVPLVKSARNFRRIFPVLFNVCGLMALRVNGFAGLVKGTAQTVYIEYCAPMYCLR